MDSAVVSLIILAVLLVLFLTEWLPSAVVAMLGCVCYALFGVCSVSDAFSGFSNSIVILVFGMLVVGDAVFETGLVKFIGITVSRLAHGSERLILLYSAIASAILSMWLSNTAVIILFLTIIQSLCATGSYSERDLALPVSMGAMFGGSCTLVGSTPQLTVQSIVSEVAGIEFRMFDYMKAGLILFGVYLAYIFLIGRPLGRRIWGGRPTEESGESRTAKLPDKHIIRTIFTPSEQGAGEPLSRKGIIVLVILAAMVLFFVLDIIPIAMVSSCAAFACVLTGCTTHKKIMRSMNWSVLLQLAGCLGIAKALQTGGGTQLAADLFLKVCGSHISPWFLLLGGVALTMLISNFITNSTAVLIVLPMILPIALALGCSPYPFGIGICYAANLTFATPLANAQTALTMVSGYRFKDYFLYNILLELLVLAVIMLFVPVFFPL